MNQDKSITTLHKRLDRDYKECKDSGIELIIDDKNKQNVICTLFGPQYSDYESGIFKLSANFPDKYTFVPPNITFITKVYHPNVSFQSGSICVDILKADNWSPALSFYKILLSIQSLLTDANPDSPLNGDAANLYKTDRKEYKKKCQKVIRESLDC